jgi:hypothetical protein
MQDRRGALGGLCLAGAGRRLAADPSPDRKEIPRTAGVAGSTSRP